MTTAYVALGSNLPSREENLARALSHLAETPGLRVLGVSRVYETEPVGLADQPWFLNQVVAVETSLSARGLLEALLAIENSMGRVRTVRWGPRLIDLDLLLYGQAVIDEPGLQVPHPRMWERRFVMSPLAELAPDLAGPDGRTAGEQARILPECPIVRLYQPTLTPGPGEPERGGELAALLGRREEPVSGEEIAHALGISRAAVWKRIAGLRDRGFRISGTPKLGYQIIAWPDRVHDFAPFLANPRALVGRRVIGLQTVDSTNLEVKRRAVAGEPEGTAVLAENQTAGRGRRGRPWASPTGLGLYLSVLLRPLVPLAEATRFTPLAALAAVRALRLQGVAAGIKWPNDIVAQGRKLGGILLEVSGDPERVDFLTLGIGLNVNHQSADFPEELVARAISARLAKGVPVDRSALAAALLRELDSLYLETHRSGFDRIMAEYRESLVTIGQEIRVSWEGGSLDGIAVDVGADGVLLVEAQGVVHRVTAGDVTVRLADGAYV